MSDGELVEQRAMPETPWLLTAGRNVAQLIGYQGRRATAQNTPHRRRRLRQRTLLEPEFDPAVRMTTLEPNLLAVVEPGGEFQLIDVRIERQADRPEAGADRGAAIDFAVPGGRPIVSSASAAPRGSSRRGRSDSTIRWWTARCLRSICATGECFGRARR